MEKLGRRYGKRPSKFAPGKMYSKGVYENSDGHLPDMEIEKIIESMLPRINMLHIHTNDRKNDLHSGLSTNNSIIKKILLPHLNDFTDKYMLIECYSIMEIEKTAEILQKIYF